MKNRRKNITRKIYGRPLVAAADTLTSNGDDPAITGEPPEEQTLTTSASVEPGGSGPSQPANERPPSLSSNKQGGKRGGTAVCPHGSGRVALAALVP
jgi:hypothetical protein